MGSTNSLLVSVIVPVCNVETYLSQCLSSILGQTHKNLEVICLNDGSTDGSKEILDEFASLDSRVKVIHKKNEGYGATCNRGLDLAQGDWISIIEPDDWIDKHMFEAMLGMLKNSQDQVDIIKTPWIDVHDWDKPDQQFTTDCTLLHRLPTSSRPFTLPQYPELIACHPSIWSALYRRAFLDEKAIRFVPYPGAGWADNPFLIETFVQASSILYLDKPYYYYRCDLAGSTYNHASKEAVMRPFERWIDMMKILIRLQVTDRGIINAHYVRGFNYVYGAMMDDGWDNPLVQKGTRQVFAMMDPALVASHPSLSVKRKKFFASVMGISGMHVSVLPRLGYLAHEVGWNLRYKGVSGLVHSAKGVYARRQEKKRRNTHI